MFRKVKLYGELAKFVGHSEFEVKVDTVGKAVSFLIHNFPEVESYMSPKYYQVKVGDSDIEKEEIHHPIGSQDIHFIPVIAGAGRGLGRVLLGAALIGLAFMVPVKVPLAPLSFTKTRQEPLMTYKLPFSTANFRGFSIR